MLQSIIGFVLKVPRVKEAIVRSRAKEAIRELEMSEEISNAIGNVLKAMGNSYSKIPKIVEDIESVIKRNPVLFSDLVVEAYRTMRFVERSQYSVLLPKVLTAFGGLKFDLKRHLSEAAKPLDIIKKGLGKSVVKIDDNITSIKNIMLKDLDK